MWLDRTFLRRIIQAVSQFNLFLLYFSGCGNRFFGNIFENGIHMIFSQSIPADREFPFHYQFSISFSTSPCVKKSPALTLFEAAFTLSLRP